MQPRPTDCWKEERGLVSEANLHCDSDLGVGHCSNHRCAVLHLASWLPQLRRAGPPTSLKLLLLAATINTCSTEDKLYGYTRHIYDTSPSKALLPTVSFTLVGTSRPQDGLSTSCTARLESVASVQPTCTSALTYAPVTPISVTTAKVPETKDRMGWNKWRQTTH